MDVKDIRKRFIKVEKRVNKSVIYVPRWPNGHIKGVGGVLFLLYLNLTP